MSKEGERIMSVDQAAAEVDRIRDIIFGSQMRQYEQRFKQFVSQLDLLNKKLEDLKTALDQQGTEQQSRTRELQEELRQRHAELDGALSSQIARLETAFGQKTVQMQEEFRQALGELRNEVLNRMDRQGADMEARTRQLTAELQRQSEELRSEFTAALNVLEEEKTNRHNLGDLLTEMGMRLKQQGSIADLLEQLDEAEGD